MKIVIRKKHLGSLSSLLVLSLFQPSASAEENALFSFSNDYEVTANDLPINKTLPALAHQPNPALTPKMGMDIPMAVYKTSITRAFDEYQQALTALEETYQDRVDLILDKYEQQLLDVQNSHNEIALIAEAKQSADAQLEQLKLEQQDKRQALQLQYHIS